MARTEGIEPSSTVLETVALPLNYIRIFIKMEWIMGIEPTLSVWKAEVLTVERYPHLVLPKRLELLRT